MRILFIGTGEIGLPTLRMLSNWREHKLVGVVTQPDKPAGRDQKLTSPSPKQAVQNLGLDLPVLQPDRIKTLESVNEIRALKPDVIVVMAYGQILPRGVLETPRVACLNLHASLLPRWRGAAPIQAAIAAGDRETGITVMYMDEGLDTGDILLQRRIAIASNETGGSLHDKLAQIAPEALAEAILLLDKEKRLAFHKKTNSPLTRPSSSANMAGSIGANPPKQSNEKSAHSIRGRARSWKLIIAI